MRRRRGERWWLRVGGALVGALVVILLVVSILGAAAAIEDRDRQAELAEARLVELTRIADRLDEQAAALEAQAEASERSRARFRVAAQLLLDALGVEDSPLGDISDQLDELEDLQRRDLAGEDEQQATPPTSDPEPDDDPDSSPEPAPPDDRGPPDEPGRPDDPGGPDDEQPNSPLDQLVDDLVGPDP